MPFEIVRNDITNMQVDAIVNTANPRPVIGSGVDAAIHAKAGPMLLEARRVIGTMNTGEACVTPGFNLPCNYVIHTVGPVWYDGCHGEAYLLGQCYTHSLKLALRNKCKTVALPLISSGNYGFPKKLALQIAVDTIREFLEKHELQVYLVVFGSATLELSGGLVDQVRSFIDDAYVQEREKAEYSFQVSRDYDFVRQCLGEPEEITEKPVIHAARTTPLPPEWELREEDLESPFDWDMGNGRKKDVKKKDSQPAPVEEEISGQTAFNPEELTRMVIDAETGFSETLLKLIDKSGEKDSEIYNRANIDRRLFSKIRNNPQYKPSKATAVAFAIALELNLEETRDFIGRAGYALSRSSKFDIIIEYFITHQRYDIYEINLMLFEFDQSLLGA